MGAPGREAPVSNAFIRKLRAQAHLSDEDAALLTEACGKPQSFPSRTDLIREGDKPGPIFVILEGWACRYKLLAEGTRQITALLMPGDCCDIHGSVLDTMEHGIATLTPARVVTIQRARMEELIVSRPALTGAFRWMQLVDEDTLRAWIVGMGRRDSLQRVAHLMCELFVRGRNVGLTENGRFEMPLTQAVLGDALGLTAVHVNRVLRKLRLRGVMELKEGTLVVANVASLATFAGFEETYLHPRIGRAA
jgi:CRP-like cAMP-binding protein